MSAVVNVPHPCDGCEVRHRAACAVLNDDEIGRLADIARIIPFHSGDNLFFEGDSADDMFVIVKGAVKLYKLLPDGRRQITGFLFAGDFLGLAFNDTYQYSTEALSSGELCRLKRSKVEALIDDLPKLGHRLLNLATHEIVAAQDQMLLLGRKSAQEKLASFLLWLSERAAQRGDSYNPVHLPMGRADMADYLGLTVETVSRTMTRLRKSALVKLAEGNMVHLVDIEALHEIADGDGAD